MRIWDFHPGYLDRARLLSLHVEMHAIYSILSERKPGYSEHPEVRRWKRRLSALSHWHDLTAAEIELRGYEHRTPLGRKRSGEVSWPLESRENAPISQLMILKSKLTKAGTEGRIPIPKDAQDAWAQHKYSVLARDPALYRQIGQRVARDRTLSSELVSLLCRTLRRPTSAGRLRNAVEHVHGYLSDPGFRFAEEWNASPKETIRRVVQLARDSRITYLTRSTALSDFPWLSRDWS